MNVRVRIFTFCLAFAGLAGCGPSTDELTFAGYVEADLTYISAREGGTIAKVFVSEGEKLAAGAPLFALDTARLAPQLESAEAKASAAKAAYEDLLTGARPDERAVRASAVREAQTELKLAEETLERTAKLFRDGHVSKARLDQDQARRDAAAERLRAAEADLRRADLPARSAAIEAADHQRRAAEADVALLKVRMSEMTSYAPAAGRTERIYQYTGETVQAGTPIVALLPDGRRKVRFFLPQALLPLAAPGTPVRIDCDGCDGAITGTITFIASEPEFTPPVIYSQEEREKLVFMVEARPDTESNLAPGAPVEVTLSP